VTALAELLGVEHPIVLGPFGGVSSVALVAAVTVVPRLMARWGARSCVAAGLGSTGAGMIVIAASAQLDSPAWLLTPAMFFIAAGMGSGSSACSTRLSAE